MKINQLTNPQLRPYEAPGATKIRIKFGNSFLASDYSATAEDFIVDTDENDQWF